MTGIPMALARSSSKDVINSCLKKIPIIKRINAPTPMVIHMSVSWTARIFPKRIWKRSVELLATLIKMTPRAKKDEKVIPMAVSLLMIEFPLM